MTRGRGRFILSAIAATVVVVLLPSPAWGSFRFNGGGWGHGIGMSQYGAYGLAQQGWSAARILRHYYRGSSLAVRNPPKSAYRVGLLQNRDRITIQVQSGSAEIRLRDGTLVESVASGLTRTILVTSGQRFRVQRPNGSTVGGQWGSSSNPIEVRRKSAGVVRVTQWGHSLGRGYLRFSVSGAARGHLVAVVNAEHYLRGLGEVPSSWPMAVLQAQAIAGRTYAYRVAAGGRSGCACDILGDTRDQAFVGWTKEAGPSGNRWVQAVTSTERKVAVHGGNLITTYYSSSSGGFTENIENVWAGSAPRPYLKGVCDPGDWVAANPNRTWSVTLSPAAVASRLGRPKGMVRVTGINVNRRGVSGRVARATVRGRTSSGAAVAWTTDGWTLRSRIGLKDTRFWVNQNRQVTGRIRQTYDRLGCKPGLPSSNQKKISGGRFQVFQKGRMYLHGGRNRVTWLRGPVLTRYLRARGHAGPLKRPFAYQGVAGGIRARFDGGDIFYRKGAGARVLRNRWLRHYLRAGGPGGRLRFPRSGVQKLRNGNRRMLFQGGRIVCRPGRGCVIRYR